MTTESLLQAIYPHSNSLYCANCKRHIREIQTAYTKNQSDFYCSMPCAWEHHARKVIENTED
jgi:hypothetical protein